MARQEDEAVVAEFFELFKTPWEFLRKGRRYDVALLLDTGPSESIRADLTIAYSNRIDSWRAARQELALQEQLGGVFQYGAFSLPIYGNVVSVAEDGNETPLANAQGRTFILHRAAGQPDIRVGYSLCDEIRTLLTRGQPTEFAACPTLELHISLLRELIVGSGIEVLEVPPVPEGHRFIACLTHDVDHPSIARHQWDRTAAGFVLRATLGSAIQLVRGRTRFRDVLANWSAAVKLPFVYLGWAEDFWSGFGKRYATAESGLPATYFVIPFGGRPGRDAKGPAPRSRAAGYGARNIADEVRAIMQARNEVGLHGIDAWIDSEAGREERKEVGIVAGEAPTGIRMHWLYFGDESPRLLENAGFAFDSTVGYRETCGFKTGTTQAYKPLNADRLLELPLHAMDTALFYPVYLNLSQTQAAEQVRALVTIVAQFGGCFTVNWHDRSLAPERNWSECYQELVAELKRQGAWFATAGDAVAWFRMRREASFDESGSLITGLSSQGIEGREPLPSLQVRVHPAKGTWRGQLGNMDDDGLAVKAHGESAASGTVER